MWLTWISQQLLSVGPVAEPPGQCILRPWWQWPGHTRVSRVNNHVSSSAHHPAPDILSQHLVVFCSEMNFQHTCMIYQLLKSQGQYEVKSGDGRYEVCMSSLRDNRCTTESWQQWPQLLSTLTTLAQVTAHPATLLPVGCGQGSNVSCGHWWLDIIERVALDQDISVMDIWSVSLGHLATSNW